MTGKKKLRRTASTSSGARFILVVILAVIFCPGGAMLEAKGNSGDGQEMGPLSRFNDQKLEKLRAGKPVYELKEASGENENTGGKGQCSIIINAPIDKCFNILVKIDLQVHYVPNKIKSRIVSRNENKLLLDNEYKFYGKTVKYHSIFTIDEKNYRIGFELDTSRPHDIAEMSGFYQLEMIDKETTLVTYGTTRFDTGFRLPNFIKSLLTGKSLPAMAINIKKYIESNGRFRQGD